MSEFIKQCKGVDADKLNISDDEMFYCSIKYDGVYVQIHKTGDVVQFFTSGGKEFYCSYGEEFKKLDFDFKVETEYTVDGGKLGTRFKADQEIKQVVKDSSFQLTGQFMIFDSLEDNVPYIERRFEILLVKDFINSVFKHTISYKEARELLQNVSADGWEGLFLVRPSHIQVAGKKSKDAIKLKKKFTADLVVTSIDGFYLSLIDEETGMTTKVSVGADVANMVEIGHIVEIEYEQIVKTYNICVFKDIRFDKMS